DRLLGIVVGQPTLGGFGIDDDGRKRLVDLVGDRAAQSIQNERAIDALKLRLRRRKLLNQSFPRSHMPAKGCDRKKWVERTSPRDGAFGIQHRYPDHGPMDSREAMMEGPSVTSIAQ